MSQAELEIGRTVIRTVEIELTQHAVEMIVTEHVRRAHGVKLKDFTLGCEINRTPLVGGEVMPSFHCVVKGEARTDGLAPTRKRKARHP